jgi:hypothetical protein
MVLVCWGLRRLAWRSLDGIRLSNGCDWAVEEGFDCRSQLFSLHLSNVIRYVAVERSLAVVAYLPFV